MVQVENHMVTTSDRARGRVGSAPPPPGTERRPARIDWLDWLRAAALLGVFVYHTLRPFTTDRWHVATDEPSAAVDAVLSFVDPWGIACFFLIAGASTLLALRHRTAGGYVRERLLRLAVPLVVAYVLLSPLQAFIEERFFGRYEGSFLDAIPLFFRAVWADLDETLLHPLGVGWTYHLWFVVFLLWFSLLGLPIFLWLRGPAGSRLVGSLGARSGRRGWTLAFPIPLVLVSLAVWPLFPETQDWGTFVYLFAFFVIGYVLMSDPRLTDAVRRDAWLALAAVVLVDVVLLASGAPAVIEDWGDDPSYSLAFAFAFTGVGVHAWAWVHLVLAVGMRARAFRRPLPRIVADAAMPFFLVHQPVILVVGAVVVRWEVGAAVVWLAIALPSFAVSAGLACAIARLPGISTLFGVKRARVGSSSA